MTEAEIFAVVRRWRDPKGDKREWIVLPQVRAGSGAYNDRTCDAIAMNAWPSRGLEIEGFEFKSYRSDWIRELQQPEKAEQLFAFCDRWYVVAPEHYAIKDGKEDRKASKVCPVDVATVPAPWGFLVVEAWREVPKIRLVKASDKLKPKEATRRFIAALLRSLDTVTPIAQIEAAKAIATSDAYADGLKAGQARERDSFAHRNDRDNIRWRRDELIYLEERAASILKGIKADLADLRKRETAPPAFVDEEITTHGAIGIESAATPD